MCIWITNSDTNGGEYLRAIISDIHANLEALQAVLKDIESQGITEVVCLGDIIGYGPDPRECIKLGMTFGFTLQGNHEEAILFQAIDFNIDARASIDWTRDQLNSKKFPMQENHSLWNFLGDLIVSRTEGDVLYVHGSPRIPTREYVLPHDIYNVTKMEEIFAQIERVCFCGHTHQPGIFTDDLKFFFPQLVENSLVLEDRKYLINVGSVGQPRDGDNRACYVMFDGDRRVIFRRVPYDIGTTVQKVLKTGKLSQRLAERLKKGK